MKFGCDQASEHLFEPEESLSEAERDRLGQHLLECADCLAERELFLESWDALGEVQEELEPCPLLRAKVWEQIRQEEREPAPAALLPRSNLPLRQVFLRLGAAAAAVMLGFGVGRALRPAPVASVAAVAAATHQAQAQEELDPALIELASQEGYSVEIFPESTQFSPIDGEMMSALAPSNEAREWLEGNQGAVVPLQYISQSGGEVYGGSPPR